MKGAKRVCIYPKDVMLLTGKSERYSRNLLLKIKTNLNKELHQVITVNEFCQYIGITIDEAYSIIK
jgi:hypothetical protein